MLTWIVGIVLALFVVLNILGIVSRRFSWQYQGMAPGCVACDGCNDDLRARDAFAEPHAIRDYVAMWRGAGR